MSRIKSILLILAGLAMLAGVQPANAGVAVAIRVGPPAPRREVVVARPGYPAVWVGGHWAWRVRGNRYVWVPGSWVRARPGAVWVEGRWVHRRDGWVYREGSWRHR